MRVAIVLPLDAEQRLADSAGYYGHEVLLRCSGGDELAVRLPHLPVELLIVAATPEHLTPALVEAADIAGVRMLVVAEDEQQARHAQRVGVIDSVGGPVDWALLDDDAPHDAAAAGLSPVAPGLVPDGPMVAPIPRGVPRRTGTVIAVWGPHGAPGRTSLAIALAAEFAAVGRMSVLADADTHAASVAPSLGMLDESPGFAAACRLAGVDGFDEAQLERLAVIPRASRHPFRVLTGIGRASRWPELTAARVAGVLQTLRTCCEVVVVDVAAALERDEPLTSDVAAPQRNAATREVLHAADHVVAVAAADPVGIPRFLHGHAELLDLVEPERVRVVANRLRASAIGLNPAGQVRQTLARFGGIGEVHFVPSDPAAFDAALLSARPLADAAPRSAARFAVRELAALLLPLPTASGRARPMRRLA